ncbi:unnamed protein product [Dicrocoelium dendriticum]|nr:unnamed protein product [Dicrocoelium dendriticum]
MWSVVSVAKRLLHCSSFSTLESVKNSSPSHGLLQISLPRCVGITPRTNDVIFTGFRTPADMNVVFFGGDVQDFELNMLSSSARRKYIQWSLEATGRLLSRRFSSLFASVHVWVIRPCAWVSEVFASYSNFVVVDVDGNPVFNRTRPTSCSTIEHLAALLIDACGRIREVDPSIDVDFTQHPISLIGFSKGCCVLTSLLYEMSTCHLFSNLPPKYTTSLTDTADSVISRVRSMYWLDSGHSGVQHQWPVCIDRLSALDPHKCPLFRIFATPYQLMDDRRPWKAQDYQSFISFLDQLHLPHSHSELFFEDAKHVKKKAARTPFDLQAHFSLLEHFDP